VTGQPFSRASGVQLARSEPATLLSTQVRTCSPSSRRTQIIEDHLHYWNAEWNARHTAAVYDHVAILLAPMCHKQGG